MSDDQERDEARRQAERRRRSDAQDAAADLARMGIDPRSLGLDTPRDPEPQGRWSSPEPGPVERPFPGPASFPADENVVALRPEWAGREADERPSPGRASGPTVGGTVERTEPTDAERLLARTASVPQRPADPVVPRLRNAARGLVTLDAAAAADDERELVARVRRRQTGRRLVGFVAAQGGVGTTTVAAGVASVLAALRDDRSVLVDVQAGSPPLSALYGVSGPQTVRQVLAQPDPADPPPSPAGFGVLDGPAWDRPLERSDVGGLLDRLDPTQTFVLADAGNDPTDGPYAVAARCDQVVVVAGPGEIGLRSLTAALTRIERTNPAAARRAVVVLVCSRGGTQAGALEQDRALGHAGETVVVGADPVLADGNPFRADLVSPATRSALLAVAAQVADPR